MKLKDQVFDAIRPYAKHYRVFKVLSVLQLLLTMAIPVVWPDIDTAMWLLSFAFFAFWLSNYSLLRLAHWHDPNQKGIRGWLTGSWENLLFLSWIALAASIVFFILKTALFIWR